MGDDIENGEKLQKENFCLVKKIGGQHWSFCLVWSGLFKKIGGHICHFVLLDQKSVKESISIHDSVDLVGKTASSFPIIIPTATAETKSTSSSIMES